MDNPTNGKKLRTLSFNDPSFSSLMASSPPIFSLSPSISSSSSLLHSPSIVFSPPRISPITFRQLSSNKEKRRLEALVARAGPPSSSTLVFAFVFPLSMVLGTIFASIRVADQLDEKYLQELIRNGAEKEVNGQSEEELSEGDKASSLENGSLIRAGTSSTVRSRNRPKRKA